MPLKRIGEESRSSISGRDGSIFSITILRFARSLLNRWCVFNWVIQIDKDRAVAAGASYGGYAIKYVLALVILDRD